MAEEQDQIEAMRQMVGAAMKQIGSDLEGVNKKAKEASSESGGLKKLDSVFVGMTKNLVGPVGTAAAIYGVAKALDNMATSTVQLYGFANNTNLAVGQVQQLQQGMRRMGMTTEEANSSIAAMTNRLNDLAAHKESSQFWQDMAKGGEGGVKLANAMKEMATAGNNMGAITEFLRVFEKQDRTAQTTMAASIGMTVDALQNLNERMKRNTEVMQENKGEAQKYLDMWVDFEVKFEDIWKKISGHGIEGINKLTEALHAEGVGANQVIGFIEKEIDGDLEGIKNTITEIKHIIDQVNAMKKWAEGFDPGYNKAKEALQNNLVVGPAIRFLNTPASEMLSGVGGLLGKAAGDSGTPSLKENLQTTGENPALRETIKSGLDKKTDEGASTFNDRFGNWSGDLIDIERNSDKTLIEVRDSLLRMEAAQSGNNAGGGEQYGKGIRTPGGAAQAGLGGFRASGAGTRADRNNNPGNIEYGEFAKAHGATGSDGRFAVFPDREAGFKASEALLGGKGYAGMTLGQIGQKWSGDPKWAGNVSKATGIDVNEVPTEAQRSQIARIGMPRAEGSRYSFGTEPGSAGGGAIPSAILDEAKKAALSGGSGGVYNYIRSHGYNVDSAWCGDFAAAVVSGAGGKPPKNPQIASNWRNYGHQVDQPEPGDIAVRRTSRFGGMAGTGSTGSHVTVVDEVGKGAFYGIGGNQGAPRSKFSRSMYDFYRDDSVASSREKVDSAQTQSGAFGKINASVEFLNVPNGIKTKADSDGDIFQQLQISRTKQAGVYGGTLGYE